MPPERIQVLDSHTGGEPTRVVYDFPWEPEGSTMQERLDFFRLHGDDYRRGIICEPRGSDLLVGALLTPPANEGSLAGVIFFNNVGYLGMCGHGAMGVAVALNYLGRIAQPCFTLDTPVGTVTIQLLDQHKVRIDNVDSYRFRQRVPLELPNGRVVHGDIAWGGNWFFICDDHGLQVTPNNIPSLNQLALEIRRQLDRQPVRAENDQVIDHIELIGAPSCKTRADARNFVLCPGIEYDRSPCGTGTSAKVACLAADGLLKPGQQHRQESIVGSVFTAGFEKQIDKVIKPWIEGAAYINAHNQLLFDPQDPFRMGIPL